MGRQSARSGGLRGGSPVRSTCRTASSSGTSAGAQATDARRAGDTITSLRAMINELAARREEAPPRALDPSSPANDPVGPPAPPRIGPRRPRGEEWSGGFGGENWMDHRKKQIAYADREPAVVVIGGSQSGLGIAACLNILGVDTLVQNLFYGGGLVCAVALSQLVRRRQPQNFS